MVDGKTPQGAWPVVLELTADEARQLVRSMDWALMMDSHEDKPGYPQRMDYLAHREFIKGIINKLKQALKEQKPHAPH